MNMANELWRKRLQSHIFETIRYLRLIVSSGFVVVLYFLIIVGGFYYRKWLENVPEHFPSALVLSALLTVVLTWGSVRTLLKEADIVFLLPSEAHLRHYFRAAYFYSFVIQLFTIIAVMFLLAPLYFTQINEGSSYFLATLGCLIVGKAWNLFAHFQEQRLQEKRERLVHLLLRFVINGLFCFFLFQLALPFVLSLLVLIVLLLIFYYRSFATQYSLKWERLLEIEANQRLFFYRIANAFVDVPTLRGAVKRRIWLDPFLSLIKYDEKDPFLYVFARTFFRYGDLFGIYVRLLLIGTLFIFIIPQSFVQIAVMIALLYMTGTQLATMSFHYESKMMFFLYPQSEARRQHSLSTFIFTLLIVETLVFSLSVFASHQDVILLLLALLLGSFSSYTYSFRMLTKKKRGR